MGLSDAHVAIFFQNGKHILEHVVEHVMFDHCSFTLNLTLTFRSPFVRHLEVSDGVSEVK